MSSESVKKLAKRDRHVATLLAMTGLSFRLLWPVLQVTIASPGGAWQSQTSNR